MGRCRCPASGDQRQREGRVLGMCWRSPSPNRSLLLCVGTRGSPAGSEGAGEGVGQCVTLVRIVRASSPGGGFVSSAGSPRVVGFGFPSGFFAGSLRCLSLQKQRWVTATEVRRL